jgi:hypothetical protein
VFSKWIEEKSASEERSAYLNALKDQSIKVGTEAYEAWLTTEQANGNDLVASDLSAEQELEAQVGVATEVDNQYWNPIDSDMSPEVLAADKKVVDLKAKLADAKTELSEAQSNAQESERVEAYDAWLNEDLNGSLGAETVQSSVATEADNQYWNPIAAVKSPELLAADKKVADLKSKLDSAKTELSETHRTAQDADRVKAYDAWLNEDLGASAKQSEVLEQPKVVTEPILESDLDTAASAQKTGRTVATNLPYVESSIKSDGDLYRFNQAGVPTDGVELNPFTPRSTETTRETPPWLKAHEEKVQRAASENVSAGKATPSASTIDAAQSAKENMQQAQEQRQMQAMQQRAAEEQESRRSTSLSR